MLRVSINLMFILLFRGRGVIICATPVFRGGNDGDEGHVELF